MFACHSFRVHPYRWCRRTAVYCLESIAAAAGRGACGFPSRTFSTLRDREGSLLFYPCIIHMLFSLQKDVITCIYSVYIYDSEHVSVLLVSISLIVSVLLVFR